MLCLRWPRHKLRMLENRLPLKLLETVREGRRSEVLPGKDGQCKYRGCAWRGWVYFARRIRTGTRIGPGKEYDKRFQSKLCGKGNSIFSWFNYTY